MPSKRDAMTARALALVGCGYIYGATGWICTRARMGYRQVLCANSFTSLAELSLHRAGKPALNYLVAEDRERVKGGEAACEALDVNSVFCYQPASSSCISMCFMLMYFFPPHWVPAT